MTDLDFVKAHLGNGSSAAKAGAGEQATKGSADPNVPELATGDTQAGAALPGAVDLPKPAETKKPLALLGAAQERHAWLSALLVRAASEGLADVELVHDLRVGSRRLGEVARLLATFLDKSTAKAVDGSLKSLRRAMGDLRDADVTREHLAKWKMPAEVKGVAKNAADELEAKRPLLSNAAQEQSASPSVQGSMVVLARALEEQVRHGQAAEARLERAVKSALKKREKQMRQAFGRAAKKQTPEALHDARIAVKKLRYVLELAHEADLDPDAKTKVKALKQIQELLGDHHDVEVIGEILRVHRDEGQSPARPPGAAWRKWEKSQSKGQAQRAAEFFVKGYQWMNG